MPTSTAIMQFVSVKGTYTFSPEEIPLISRRLDYMRPTDQGYGGRKIICTLQGFVEGNYHSQVIAQYQQLIEVIKCNDAAFTYMADGNTGVMVNQRVYIDDYTDPTDWKEFNGDYTITFHYFEKPNYNTQDLGIQAIYEPRRESNDKSQTDPEDPNYQVPLMAYTFDPPPFWAMQMTPTRANFRGRRTTPSGSMQSNEMTITLSGFLYAKNIQPATGQQQSDPSNPASNYEDLYNQIEALKAAFNYDGTLTYGKWINQVRVVDVQIPTTFPRDYCPYNIILKYDSIGITEFRFRKRFARLHNFPKITELPWCGTVRIQEFEPLGQVVNYFASIRGASEAAARTTMANEVQFLIAPNGVELEGGTEEWDDSENTLTLACSKYYAQPIQSNLDLAPQQ